MACGLLYGVCWTWPICFPNSFIREFVGRSSRWGRRLRYWFRVCLWPRLFFPADFAESQLAAACWAY